MIKKISVLILLLVGMTNSIHAQIEHNFKMNPEKTDCHELVISSDSVSHISSIRNASFRVKQELKISRYHIPNRLEYYSCDGATGYVIATESSEKVLLYKTIRMSLWDSLLITEDPISFYFKYLKKSNRVH